MTDAFSGLTQQVQFAVLNKTQLNYNTIETIEAVSYFQASLQPLHPQQLAIKPEGQRMWKWYSMWCKNEIPMDNYIRDAQGLQYRVMSKSDWSQAGYIEYQIVQSSTVLSEAP
jgi:hypothetical protein